MLVRPSKDVKLPEGIGWEGLILGASCPVSRNSLGRASGLVSVLELRRKWQFLCHTELHGYKLDPEPEP